MTGADAPAIAAPPALAPPAAPDRGAGPSARFSLLFADPSRMPAPADPEVLRDLGLDPVFEALAKGREEHDLLPLFRTPPTDPAETAYRQGVFRDLLAGGPVLEAVRALAAALARVREALGRSRTLHHPIPRERWHVEAAAEYCGGIARFVEAIDRAGPRSEGLVGLAAALRAHLEDPSFRRLAEETDALRSELDGVAYTVRIRETRVEVRRPGDEPDLADRLAATFGRFARANSGGRAFSFRRWDDLSPVEEAIVERVARLYPETFARMREFAARHREFPDPMVARIDRELAFYLAYLGLADRLAGQGIPFCLPAIEEEGRAMDVRGAVDLALAAPLAAAPARPGGIRPAPGRAIVPNDVLLTGPERVLIVTGPNNGGKTTFARMVGQLHYLARLGVPVPASSARLFRSDRVFTHFARGEAAAEMRGRLMDELVRIRAILSAATDRSVLVLNETFASATVRDAEALGRRVLERIRRLGAVGVSVTFLDELSTLGPETVSVVAEVAPDDPAIRTFRLTRRPADGRAYALAVARKYGLTYEILRDGRLP
ncbi:MAG: DNA mismatch repair protein MutS [Thermoplasmata archaeon]